MTTYADRPWAKSYDEGVPVSLDPYPDHPLHDFLRQSAQRFPEHPLTLTSASVPNSPDWMISRALP